MCLSLGVSFIIFDFVASTIESIRALNASKNDLKNINMVIENSDDYEPDFLTVEEYYLRNHLNDDSTVEDCVRVFKEMCNMPIDDDLLLFECFKQDFGEEKFIFSLVRQYPNGEGEYCQLRVMMEFELSGNTWGLNETMWSDKVPDFWKYIEDSKAYEYARTHKAKRVVIRLDET